MYTTFDEANITVLAQAKPEDPDVSLVKVSRFGEGDEPVLALTSTLTTEEHEVVGKLYEVRGELWFALNDETIKRIGSGRPRQITTEALRVLGWNL